LWSYFIKRLKQILVDITQYVRRYVCFAKSDCTEVLDKRDEPIRANVRLLIEISSVYNSI